MRPSWQGPVEEWTLIRAPDIDCRGADYWTLLSELMGGYIEEVLKGGRRAVGFEGFLGYGVVIFEFGGLSQVQYFLVRR